MQTNEILYEIIDKINAMYGSYADFAAVFGYEHKPDIMPIDKMYVVLTADENGITFFEDDNSECCKKTTVKVGIDFIVPNNVLTSTAFTRAETILDNLTTQYAGTLTEYKLGGMTADKDLKAGRIHGVMTFVYNQCPAYGVGGAAIIPYADFLCKTHVKDTAAHLSENEKSYLSQPFVTGSYNGDGMQEQTVIIGFRPKFVFVFESGAAGTYESEGRKCTSFSAAIRNRAMRGISISENGFTVKSGETVVSHSVYVLLNQDGHVYNYIAFK